MQFPAAERAYEGAGLLENFYSFLTFFKNRFGLLEKFLEIQNFRLISEFFGSKPSIFSKKFP